MLKFGKKKVFKKSDEKIKLPPDGYDYSEGGKKSIKVTGGISIINSFTNTFYRRILINPFYVYVRRAIVKSSVEKIKIHGIFSAFLINRLDIFRIMNLLL